MKKCAIVYTNESTGKEFWACSVDERGATYCLYPKETDIPRNHHEASEFYGAKMLERAQSRIDKDTKLRAWLGYTGRVVEYEDEPEWYFEIWYVLEHAFGDDIMSEVKKGFPLDPNVEYKLFNGHNRPLIHDLGIEELRRYYEYRKTNFRGRIKDV